MKPKVYLETSIISYLAARPSRDLVVAAHQQITDEWWEKHRNRFDLHSSEPIEREAAADDPDAAACSLELLAGIPPLIINDTVFTLAAALLDSKTIPQRAVEDAFHIALATVQRMDYPLTWNCRHIANATLQKKIGQMCRNHGFEPPTVTTPEQLLEE